MSQPFDMAFRWVFSVDRIEKKALNSRALALHENRGVKGVCSLEYDGGTSLAPILDGPEEPKDLQAVRLAGLIILQQPSGSSVLDRVTTENLNLIGRQCQREYWE